MSRRRCPGCELEACRRKGCHVGANTGELVFAIGEAVNAARGVMRAPMRVSKRRRTSLVRGELERAGLCRRCVAEVYAEHLTPEALLAAELRGGGGAHEWPTPGSERDRSLYIAQRAADALERGECPRRVRAGLEGWIYGSLAAEQAERRLVAQTLYREMLACVSAPRVDR